MQGVGGQRRLSPRQPIRARVLVTPLTAGREPFWARTEDLSADGILVNTVQPMHVDELVTLDIGTEEGARLSLDAVVLHVIPGAGFGCKFTHVSPRTRVLLSELVSRATLRPHAAPRAATERKRRKTLSLWDQ